MFKKTSDFIESLSEEQKNKLNKLCKEEEKKFKDFADKIHDVLSTYKDENDALSLDEIKLFITNFHKFKIFMFSQMINQDENIENDLIEFNKYVRALEDIYFDSKEILSRSLNETLH